MNLLSINFIENIAAGLIGAFLIFFYTRVVATAKDFLFKRKISLEGEYISYFYDTQNGERVKSIANAEFKQYRHILKGKSELLLYAQGLERAWSLSAEIVDQRNILGNYICTTPLQGGMGTFSLRILNDDLLTGHWSGYDSDNNIMNYGEYVFRKVLKVKLKKAKKSEWGIIIRICDQVLGKDYIESLKESQLEFYVAKTQQNGVVGFVAFKRLPAECLSTEFPSLDNERVPPPLKYCDSHGLVRVIKTIAVDPKYHGRGIGTKLFKLAHEKCIDSDTNAIVVPVWKQGNVINIKSILDNEGYTLFAEIPEYWKNDCDNNLFKCPAREPNKQCVCSLAIYWQLITKL